MKKLVIALGFFDSVHKGHREILNKTVSISNTLGATPCVFTFDGDLNAYFGKTPLQVLTKNEKEETLKNIGIKEIIYAPITKEYLSKSKEQFLVTLDESGDILGYVCGDDFSFGKNAEGKTIDLINYAKTKGRFVEVVEEVSLDGVRVSTTAIKQMLSDGNIKGANQMLTVPFSVTGKVIKGRGDGKKSLFPTVNIEFSSEKYMPKTAVYAGFVIVDGKKYRSVINYGNAPTFDYERKVLEGYIVAFNGDLYGKTITLYFTDYIREIVKFSSIEELKERIKKDLEFL